MRRTRKWAFVAQEAIRLAALGLAPSEIAKRLGVNKSTVTRWIASGKLTRAAPPRAPDLSPHVHKSPDEWAAAVREAYDLDATDDQLVVLAETALRLSLDLKLTAAVRMTAAGRFQALVKQLALIARKVPEVPIGPPAAIEEPKKPVVPRVRTFDPRTHLMAVK
jgi:plasmid maintenance system antidote protein VapI